MKNFWWTEEKVLKGGAKIYFPRIELRWGYPPEKGILEGTKGTKGTIKNEGYLLLKKKDNMCKYISLYYIYII